MEFKPNEISKERAEQVVRKFKDHNKGVVLTKPYTSSRNWDEFSAKWANIIDPEYCSIRNIRDKMIELFAKIRNTPEDSVLGDMTVAFVHKTERGKEIPFTFEDMYIFCREAISYRKETEDYKAKVRELQLNREFLNKNKSTDTLVAEAEARVKALEAELDEETTTSSESTTSTTTESPTAS